MISGHSDGWIWVAMKSNKRLLLLFSAFEVIGMPKANSNPGYSVKDLTTLTSKET
jgi:hypothetical protein